MAEGGSGRSQARTAFEERWRRRFLLRGHQFDDDASIAGWSPTGLDARFRRFHELWPGTRPGSLWVDAGCGAGTYTRYLESVGARAIGLDYSAPSVAKARNRCGNRGMWVAADVRHLPLARGFADGILCLGVMQALESPDSAIKAMMETLKPEGVLWVDALNAWCLPNLGVRLKRALLRQPKHLRYDYPWSLCRRIRALGYTQVQLYWLPLAPARFAWLQTALEHPATRWLFQRVPLLGLLCSHSFILVVTQPSAGAHA